MTPKLPIYAVLVALAWPLSASADDEPRVELTGARPLVVAAGGGTARFQVVNTGALPLQLNQVNVRGNERMPAAAGFSVAPAPLPLTLEPGQRHEVVVVWRPEGPHPARQLFGHVEVATNDPHQPRVAMGVTSRSGSFVRDHLLTLITFVPIAGLLAIFALFVSGRGTDRVARLIAYVTTAIPLALSVWLVVIFDGAFGRADGNGGIQLIEHVVWIRSFNIE
jgi:NADH-quinone oxidoreductase subunit M